MILDPEIDRLLQEVLDGSATPEEAKRVETLLAASPEGRERRRELEHLFQSLSRTPLVDAPADLRDSVLRKIRALPVPAAHDPGWLSAARDAFARRPLLGVAFPFAAGVAVGVIALSLGAGRLGGPPAGTNLPVGGTMMTPGARPEGAPSHRREWRWGETHVTLEASRAGDRTIARLDCRAAANAEIVVRFDPATTALAALRRTNPASGTLEALPGSLTLRPAGDAEYILEFHQPAPAGVPIHVSIRTPGGSGDDDLPAASAASGGR